MSWFVLRHDTLLRTNRASTFRFDGTISPYSFFCMQKINFRCKLFSILILFWDKMQLLGRANSNVFFCNVSFLQLRCMSKCASSTMSPKVVAEIEVSLSRHNFLSPPFFLIKSWDWFNSHCEIVSNVFLYLISVVYLQNKSEVPCYARVAARTKLIQQSIIHRV